MSIIPNLISISQDDIYAYNVTVHGRLWDQEKYIICTPVKYNYIIKALETITIETILIHSAVRVYNEFYVS